MAVAGIERAEKCLNTNTEWGQGKMALPVNTYASSKDICILDTCTSFKYSHMWVHVLTHANYEC